MGGLAAQPILYPVTNEVYVAKTCGQDRSRLEHEIRIENGIRHAHEEYWIPAEEDAEEMRA
jgi:hypothetical protein